MKTFLILAAVASAALARPGGYTATGGVYKFDPDRELDYMQQARDAGKFAWNKKFEEEANTELEARGERNAAVYVPTFFTGTQNHQILLEAVSQVQEPSIRAQRQAQQPIYYQ